MKRIQNKIILSFLCLIAVSCMLTADKATHTTHEYRLPVSYSAGNMQHNVQQLSKTTVTQYGAYGDGIHDDSDAIQMALSKTGEINLEPDKTYRLTKGLLLPSNAIINGNNSTFLIDDINFFMNPANTGENNGKGLFYYQFFFPENYSTSSELLEINNLSIHWKVEKELTHVSTYYLFLTNDVNTIRFDNVEIKIEGNQNNSIHPLKFNQHSDLVTLNNCQIANYVHGFGGSCIWFHANSPEGYPNVQITNSTFYSEAHDEILSLWGPYSKKIYIKDSIFHRHCVPCLSADRKSTSPSYVCFVSKSTDSINHSYINNNPSTQIVYDNCDIIVTSQSNAVPYYFIAASSHYGSPVNTLFKDCNITGTFSKAFISGENTAADQTTHIDSSALYYQNLNVDFDNCNISLNVPTFTTSRSVNCSFNNCNITTNNNLMDMLYVDSNLITCSKYVFTNNTVTLNNRYLKTIYKDLSPQFNNYILVTGNTFYYNSKNAPTLYTVTNKDYSRFTKRHTEGAGSSILFYNNSIIKK